MTLAFWNFFPTANGNGIGREMSKETQTGKPLRVALFSGNFNYVMDGPVRALGRLVTFLENKGVEVRVYAPTSKTSYLPHPGTLISIPSLPLPGRSEYRLGLGLPKKIQKDLDAFAPDIVHLAAPDWIGHSALKYAKKRGLPVLASYHTRFDTYGRYYGGAVLEKYITSLLRKFYNQCDVVMPPAPSMVDELLEQGFTAPLSVWSRGVDRDLYNPSKRDLGWRQQLGFADDDMVILFVGRIVLEKGIDFFCNVLDSLQESGAKFKVLVVGEGPAREYFTKRCAGAVFTGYLEGENLARAYASSDIFFNPSISEAFGNVTLEAMAAQRPCVCADATGSSSLVAHEQSGYLLPYGDVAQFSSVLQKLLQDTDLCKKMGKVGRTRSAAHDWETILGSVLHWYQKLTHV
jgi:glycosyltransferase involved in cell wall biosynthesis